jgi:hypothetical protein
MASPSGRQHTIVCDKWKQKRRETAEPGGRRVLGQRELKANHMQSTKAASTLYTLDKCCLVDLFVYLNQSLDMFS